MYRKLMMVAATLLMFGGTVLAADKAAFMGVVSDSQCGAKHSTAGDDAAACVGKCVAGGATYVLATSDGKVYQLDNQDKFKDYAGKSVKVKGTANGDSIAVESVEAAGT
jgi:Protein of unknown function (DUF5818)